MNGSEHRRIATEYLSTMNPECNQSGVLVSHLRQSENAPNGPSILGFGRVVQQEFPKACCQEERQKCRIFAIGVQIQLTLRK